MTPPRSGLLVIDLQLDYFPGGRHPLVGADDAVVAARTVLDRFRADGAPVVHVQHHWDAPDAEYLQPGTPGVDLHPDVVPIDGEPLLTKEFPNAFLHTSLSSELDRARVDRLVVVGMMTSMCVDATVRAALDRGLEVSVVADACAAPDLAYGGRRVDGASVHAAFLAALEEAGARVTESAAIDAEL